MKVASFFAYEPGFATHRLFATKLSQAYGKRGVIEPHIYP